MFKNEVSILKKDNKKQSISLDPYDNDLIQDITEGMSVFKVNSYDAQVIRRDLIGMSQELRLRDSSLKETIGDSLTCFTLEIINNSSGPSFREIFLWFLEKISLYMLATLILLSFLAYRGFSWKVTPLILLFYIGYGSIMFIIEGIVTPLFSTKKGLMKNMPAIIATLLVLLLVFITKSINDSPTAMMINASYLIIISGLIYVISKYLYSKHIHELAKDKKNFIQDLI